MTISKKDAQLLLRVLNGPSTTNVKLAELYLRMEKGLKEPVVKSQQIEHLRRIHDLADHALNTEAANIMEVMIFDLKEIFATVKKAIQGRPVQ